ncbi:hypothetical protein K9B32_05585 [Rhizobium sp. 3T7]|uniref:hypothetical protein n=1 Tax=Rhizobium sp. 3T7 TaxID=2874922 RepID=UPI001CCAD167|nr:hypothetical protein [Rhizobium sp. 3T7]MBZ9789604.1 hypothetical protein [Rhizobium sp. 3T7]
MNSHIRVLQFGRKAVEAKIEELIDLLDQLDGDADLEDGADDEPSVGSAWVGNRVVDDIEFDEAERGIADKDALELLQSDGGFGEGFHFDGSGQAIARKMLRGIR